MPYFCLFPRGKLNPNDPFQRPLSFDSLPYTATDDVTAAVPLNRRLRQRPILLHLRSVHHFRNFGDYVCRHRFLFLTLPPVWSKFTRKIAATRQSPMTDY